jgi:transposase-like protein
MSDHKKRKHTPSPLSKAPFVRRTEEEMKVIIEEISSGSIAIMTACKRYGLNRNTLKLWMTRLSVRSLADKLDKSITSSMEDEKKVQDYKHQIRHLTKSLEYAKLRILGLETMINVTEEDLQIKIRKKHGTKQSKE